MSSLPSLLSLLSFVSLSLKFVGQRRKVRRKKRKEKLFFETNQTLLPYIAHIASRVVGDVRSFPVLDLRRKDASKWESSLQSLAQRVVFFLFLVRHDLVVIGYVHPFCCVVVVNSFEKKRESERNRIKYLLERSSLPQRDPFETRFARISRVPLITRSSALHSQHSNQWFLLD